LLFHYPISWLSRTKYNDKLKATAEDDKKINGLVMWLPTQQKWISCDPGNKQNADSRSVCKRSI